ncbi:MAG: DNA topoisomerase I [Promethearchaeati archaeon SRVP18_Atabeyarchaeia-1]
MDNKFTLILAEKPDAAKRIATALAQKIISSPGRGELPFYEILRNGERIRVMAAVGHLYTLKQSGKGWDYPVLSMEWVPRYEVDKTASNTRRFVQKFRELSVDTGSFMVATDYDIEGETIAYCILKYACGENAFRQAKRLRFSSLTDRELVEAYEHPLAHIDLRMAEAGETRHKVDWLFGINISRALILAVKHATGRYWTLSTGRVQGPTLTFVANRESAIRSFVPTPYWIINASAEMEGQFYHLGYSKDKIKTLDEAKRIVDACLRKKGIIEEIEKKQNKTPPPHPFDLGSLQSEAYKLFGYTPSRTSSIAERLYLAALISYPRTGSQKIPASLDPRSILKPLTRIKKYEPLVTELLRKEKLVPSQGRKEDPAHPPITPTGVVPSENALSEPENRIFDLIVRRFMAIYGDPAVSETVSATVNVNGETFYLRGRKLIEKGWRKFYEPYIKEGDVLLPEIRVGQIIENIEASKVDKFTGPPPRYNPGTLLRLMEEQEIGTKATRAEIIDTLNRRGYVTGEQVVITDLGFAIVDVLRKYSPEILSVDTTRQLERDIERIQFGEIKGPEVISRTISFLEPVLQEFKARETVIGTALNEALRESLRKSSTIGPCPACKAGELMVIRSRKTGKRFVGCTNYQNGGCRFTAPLPQSGVVQPTFKKCPSCQFPIVIVKLKGRKPWQLCINPECETKTRTRAKRST